MNPSEYPSSHISRLSNLAQREIQKVSTRGSYTGTLAMVMHFILAHGDAELFQKEIESEFSLRPPTASQLLKKLETDGYITREPVPYDGRLKKILPTEKAKQYTPFVEESLEAINSRITKGISKKDLETWLRVSKKMQENLSD